MHNLSHPGICASRTLITAKFVWPGVRKQVAEWAKACIPCQTAKIHHHVSAPLAPFVVPQCHFDHINVDLVGPLPTSSGFSYLFAIIDRFTHWPEAIPLIDQSTTSCARALLSHWIAHFGMPSSITSDRGSQFTSAIWSALMQLLGSVHHQTTSFHPQANGMVKCFHRSLKAALRACLSGLHWIDELPWVLLGVRTVPKGSSTSLAELVYGSPLVVPGDLIVPPSTIPQACTFLPLLHQKVGHLVPTPASHHCVQVLPSLCTSQFVFLHRDAHCSPLQWPYEGPFKVLVHGDKTFKIQRGNHTKVISIDQLKPAHLDLDQLVQVALPHPRGRPNRAL